MSNLAGALETNLGFVLGAVLLVFLAVLLFLLTRVQRARDAASYLDADGGEPPPGGTPLQVIDWRAAPHEAEQRLAFERGLALLSRYMPGLRSRYQLPWLLVLGPTGAGKTTLLADAGLKLPFGVPEEPPGVRTRAGFLWWLFDRAVALDVSGDLVLRPDGASSNQAAWLGLLRDLRRYRQRRPADGILLVLPVTEVLGYDPDDARVRGALAQRAELLRRRLDQARRVLGFEVPVTLLVSQCDLVPGVTDLAAMLSPGERQQMFGWSNPNPPEVPYSPTWVTEALESVATALDHQQLRRVGEAAAPTGQRPAAEAPPPPHGAALQGYIALPETLLALRPPLEIYCNQLFSAGAGGDPSPLRGLYLAAGAGFGAAAPGGEPRPAPHVDFVADLFAWKLLYEWSLARPVGQTVRRRRRLRRALQAACAVTVVAAPLLLWVGGRQLRRNAEALRTQFLEPALGAVTLEGGRDVHGHTDQRPDAERLLAAAKTLTEYDMRTLYLPASWWSRFPRRLELAGTGIYSRIVFPAISTELDGRLRDLAAAHPTPLPTRPVYWLADVPAFEALDATVRGVGDVEGGITLYNSFTKVACPTDVYDDWTARFTQLAEDFSPALKPMTLPGIEARWYYGDVLCALQAPPFAAAPERDTSLREQVLRLAFDSTGTLFKDNVLVGDLDDLQKKLDTLARTPPAAAAAPQFYRDLIALIDRTRTDLAHPQLAWAGRPKLNLGPAWLQVQSDIEHSSLLGIPVAQDIAKQADAGYDDLRQQLAAYGTGPTGPLLAQKNGAPELQLSAEVLGLRTALDALVTRYAQPPRDQPALVTTAPQGTYLSWNAAQLGSAATQLADYQAFVNKGFKGYPGFEQVVSLSTRAVVEWNVLQMAAWAESFPALPDLSTRELRESLLAAQVANLATAAAPLNQLLQGFTQPPPVTACSTPAAAATAGAYCRLAQAVDNQRQALLAELDVLREAQQLYTPAPGSMTSWNGRSNLAWSAFSVTSATALTAYLASQRQVAQALASQYAAPIQTSVPTVTASSSTPTQLAARWSLIRSDVDDYNNKKPDNALQLIEAFIGGDLAGATLDNCLALEAKPAGDACFAPSTPSSLTLRRPPCDVFVEARVRLRLGLDQRCLDLNATAGEVAWGSIQAAFAEDLAGRYPFAPATAAGHPATPADLVRFFRVFDAEQARVSALLALSPSGASGARDGGTATSTVKLPWTAAGAAEIRTFLDQMRAVRAFFSSFLDGPAGVGAGTAAPATPGTASAPAGTSASSASGQSASSAPGQNAGGAPAQTTPVLTPSFAVTADFRPYPAQEQGGAEIIERALQLGAGADQATLVWRSPPPTPASVWTYGMPAQLLLRWAKDGPVAPAAAAPGAVVDGRTETWSFTDPWALLHLLRDHASNSADPAGAVVFEAPTQLAQPAAGGGAESATPPSSGAAPSAPSTGAAPAAPLAAKIFVRIQLWSAALGGTSQAPLTLPVFPTAAPAPKAPTASPTQASPATESGR